MLKDSDFYNVLRDIANSLRGINESLKKLNNSNKLETEQFLKESKKRMRDNKVLLTEVRKRELEQNAQKMLRESKLSGNNNVNNGK